MPSSAESAAGSDAPNLGDVDDNYFTPDAKKRKISNKNEEHFYDSIVSGGFDANYVLLKKKLENKNGLMCFLLSMVDNGKLEEAYTRQMAGTLPCNNFPPEVKFVKSHPISHSRDFLAWANPDAFGDTSHMTEAEQKTHKLEATLAKQLERLALDVDDSCWIFSRDRGEAMERAKTRYDFLGRRLDHFSSASTKS